jgi:lipopolysaccharide export LptBFGC system permease protein LptF
VSVGFALGYHVLVNAAATLARSGLVGPALAMWIPNAAILASAVFMLARTAADRRPYPTALLRSHMMRGRTSR